MQAVYKTRQAPITKGFGANRRRAAGTTPYTYYKVSYPA